MLKKRRSLKTFLLDSPKKIPKPLKLGVYFSMARLSAGKEFLTIELFLASQIFQNVINHSIVASVSQYYGIFFTWTTWYVDGLLWSENLICILYFLFAAQLILFNLFYLDHILCEWVTAYQKFNLYIILFIFGVINIIDFFFLLLGPHDMWMGLFRIKNLICISYFFFVAVNIIEFFLLGPYDMWMNWDLSLNKIISCLITNFLKG